jgi:hypothetical protein
LATDNSDTLPSHAFLVAEIGIDQPTAYPAGKGSAAIYQGGFSSGAGSCRAARNSDE